MSWTCSIVCTNEYEYDEKMATDLKKEDLFAKKNASSVIRKYFDSIKDDLKHALC